MVVNFHDLAKKNKKLNYVEYFLLKELSYFYTLFKQIAKI
jgi:hypothetical protein